MSRAYANLDPHVPGSINPLQIEKVECCARADAFCFPLSHNATDSGGTITQSRLWDDPRMILMPNACLRRAGSGEIRRIQQVRAQRPPQASRVDHLTGRFLKLIKTMSTPASWSTSSSTEVRACRPHGPASHRPSLVSVLSSPQLGPRSQTRRAELEPRPNTSAPHPSTTDLLTSTAAFQWFAAAMTGPSSGTSSWPSISTREKNACVAPLASARSE